MSCREKEENRGKNAKWQGETANTTNQSTEIEIEPRSKLKMTDSDNHQIEKSNMIKIAQRESSKSYNEEDSSEEESSEVSKMTNVKVREKRVKEQIDKAII